MQNTKHFALEFNMIFKEQELLIGLFYLMKEFKFPNSILCLVHLDLILQYQLMFNNNGKQSCITMSEKQIW